MIIAHSKGAPLGQEWIHRFATNAWKTRRVWAIVGDISTSSILTIQLWHTTTLPIWELNDWSKPKDEYDYVCWEDFDDMRYDIVWWMLKERFGNITIGELNEDMHNTS